MTNKQSPLATGRFLLLLIALSGTDVWAQANRLNPAIKDLPYDNDHPSQVVDVYLADTDSPVAAMVYIHGGGWRAGSKNSVPQWLLQAIREGWLSVVSVEYRFTDVAVHPAQVNDCLRAIQFVRSHATEWKINPDRIGVTGGSAGGHLSLYVAVKDDAAAPESQDPVERFSSRVRCAVSFAGPTDWSLLSELEHRHPAYRQLIGYKPETPADQIDKAKAVDVSPISFVSSDDPPVMQVHGNKDDIVPMEHAQRMDAALKQAGVRSQVVVIDGGNHGVAGAGPQVTREATAFVKELLKP
ncbi:MAG: alpha/beta hydrolase [Planctomycetaceae bacterium]|nr:alpha/beta hydrolase [Planctomycetaceae bacterium]